MVIRLSWCFVTSQKSAKLWSGTNTFIAMHLLQLFRTAKSPCCCCRCLVSSFIRSHASSTCKQLPSFHLQHNSCCACALRKNYFVVHPIFFFPQKKLTSALYITSTWTMLIKGPGSIHIQRSLSVPVWRLARLCAVTLPVLALAVSCSAMGGNPAATHRVLEQKIKKQGDVW